MIVYFLILHYFFFLLIFCSLRILFSIFLLYSFPPPNSSHILSHTLFPLSFIFFFLLTEKKEKILKITESNLCWPITPELGAFPEVWLIYPESHYWRKTDFFSTSSYQLWISSLLSIDLSTVALRLWLTWACTVLMHGATVSVSLYVQLPYCGWKMTFL